MAQFLKLVFTAGFKKQYKRVPSNIRQKFAKQLQFLVKNYRYPSLRTKKMSGIERFEARVDYHYRFTFEIEKETLILRTIGPHDEGLGKK